jgi:hypothetical protein
VDVGFRASTQPTGLGEFQERDRDVFRNRVSLAHLSEDAQTFTETRFLSLGDMVSVTGRDRDVLRNRVSLANLGEDAQTLTETSRNRVSLAHLGEDAQTLTETRFLSLGDMVSATGLHSETGFLLPILVRMQKLSQKPGFLV